MLRTLMIVGGLALTASGAAAQSDDEMASEDEVSRVAEAIAMFNCEVPDEVEKESENLYELDDAVCEAGQYDIKLDADMTVTSMTYDGPIDDD